MVLTVLLIWASWLALAVSAAWALAWSVDSGQFEQLDRAARAVFDDEPAERGFDAVLQRERMGGRS